MERFKIFREIDDMLRGLHVNEQIERFESLLMHVGDQHKAEVIEFAGFASVGVFAKTHLPDYCSLPFGDHHQQFFDAIPRGARGQKVNIIAPRGSAKSSALAIFYPLHCIYYKYLYEEFEWCPERFILILSRTYDNAKDRIKDIKTEIETRPSLQHLHPAKGGTWGERRTITANDILLAPQGRGGKVRGLLYKGNRPSLVLPDDIDDMEALRNPDILKKDEDWFNSDLMECGDRNTNFINVDTVKGEMAITNQLRQKPAWKNVFIQAIPEPNELTHPTAEPLWDQYRKIYTNIAMPESERLQAMDAFYDANEAMMTEGVIETWTEKWTYREIREKEFDQGRLAVMREYQNYPLDLSLAIFDMENAVRFTASPVAHPDEIGEGIERSDGRHVDWSRIIGATVFLDWAGIKDTLDNCYAAVVTVLWEPAAQAEIYEDTPQVGAYGYVYDVWLDRGSRGAQITALCDAYQDVHRLLSTYAYDKQVEIYCEGFVDTTGDIQENFYNHYRSIADAKTISAPLQILNRSVNKEDRIAGLEAPIGNGWLAFREGLDAEFMRQMRQFPVSEFNDGPDALEGCWQNIMTQSASARRARRSQRQQRIEESWENPI